MDSRGPPEGAPGNSLEMPIIDKSCEISDNWQAASHFLTIGGDQSRKSNNRLLFLTVEYIEDQSRDYSRMFPAYEQVSFSPRAASPLSDFEHRVSPLDPNMSSAARYSPTPVPLPPLPFHNSVVVLQGPPSPLIVQPGSEANTPTSMNFVADQTNDRNPRPSENVADFGGSGNEEGLVSGVGGDLILMQGTASELESATAPLMLTGIPGTEFALTRDFLVMADEQINVMAPLRSDMGDEQSVVVARASEAEEDNGIGNSMEIPAVGENISGDTKASAASEEPPKKDETEKRIVRRSKRQINDKKTFSCDECDSAFHKTGECTSNNVRTIADQPVPSRAIATLPGSYLSINKLSGANSSSGNVNFGVFAKRNIRARTQFGPIEGIFGAYNGKVLENSLPLIYETESGEFMRIDVSDENASNWMRFVRPATTYKEQNLAICQQADGIVFLTTRNILPKEELRAGPNADYAVRRNLPVLEPEYKDDTELTDSNVWPCFECSQRFSTSEKLQKHLTIHDSPKSETKSRLKRRKLGVGKKKLFKVVDGKTLLYTCPHCPKVFPRSYSLTRHLLIHPGATAPRYECPTCGEKFLHPYNRSRHMKIYHEDDGTKEKENSRQNSTEWRCTTCSLIFDKSTLLKIHAHQHTGQNSKDDLDNFCPQCDLEFKTREKLVNHVTTRHGRSQLPKTGAKVAPLASHKCSMCYKRFATKVRLQQHYLVHGAEDQKPLPCNICLKRFMNNSALLCHLKTHREDKQIFECPMCRELFNQVLMLKDHIETHRNEDETFSCPQCPRTFVKYSVIRKHIRAHHCERKHKCQFCAKRFPTVDKLRMHLLRHSDYREFHCANCEKRFKRKDKLKEHMTRMHNSQRIKRDQAAQNNQLKKFVPKVSPTDYNRFVYKCHQCLVGFKRRGMLVNHLAKRHPDVSPESVPELNLPIMRQTRDYYCQYCDKVYKSSSKRKAHIVKNHPGAALPPSNRHKEADVPGLPNSTFSQTVGSVTTTPQGCQWCHKQYASKAKLLQHQRKKHSSLMEPADKVPRTRNRLSRDRSQSSSLVDANFLLNDYIQQCDIETDFLKPKIIKLTSDIELIGNGLELTGPQFVRMRDIR